MTGFESWNIFDSALFVGAQGHHYWETKALAGELIRRGKRVRVFTHRVGPAPADFRGVEIVPTFSLSTWDSVSNDPVWSTLENFFVHSRSLHQDLSALDKSQFFGSLALFPTLRETQLLGVIRWLGGFSAEAAPKAAVCLMPPTEWSNTDRATGLYKTVWRDCALELRERLAIFARTPLLADLFATHTGMPAKNFPYPAQEELMAPTAQARHTDDEPMLISFVGGARLERGSELLSDVVKRCAGLGVRFFIQAKHDSIDDLDAVLSGLSVYPRVEVRAGPMEREDYYAAIANSVALLPYRPSGYRWRDSGVYQEAKLLGAPVLVSAGTWMADEVRSQGNGLVIEELSPEGVVDCIVRAQHNLSSLRAAAVRVAKEMRDQHGAARCIDAIANAWAKAGAP